MIDPRVICFHGLAQAPARCHPWQQKMYGIQRAKRADLADPELLEVGLDGLWLVN